ncbi:MAG: hypothetical protein KIT09_12295 [Bryobacteraceae bacterium]|nr:hypothetical protein [Bryobacteraceae bacterium]
MQDPVIGRTTHPLRSALQSLTALIAGVCLTLGVVNPPAGSTCARSAPPDAVLYLHAGGLASGAVVPPDPKRLRTLEFSQLKKAAGVLAGAMRWSAPDFVVRTTSILVSYRSTLRSSPGPARSPPPRFSIPFEVR